MALRTRTWKETEGGPGPVVIGPPPGGSWPLLSPSPPGGRATLKHSPSQHSRSCPGSVPLGLLRVILTLGGAVCLRCKQPVALECVSF